MISMYMHDIHPQYCFINIPKTWEEAYVEISIKRLDRINANDERGLTYHPILKRFSKKSTTDDA